jgi:U3 small nucleolar ribonucleoprotein protein IMP4
MIRKNIRLRKEYLYNKEQEKKNQEDYVKKMKIRDAMASTICIESLIGKGDKKTPTELYREEDRLKKSIEAEDVNTASNF